LEDLQLPVPVSFNDIDVPRTIQRYLVEITANHGTLQLQRYNRLQFFNDSRDGFNVGTEEDFDDLVFDSQVGTEGRGPRCRACGLRLLSGRCVVWHTPPWCTSRLPPCHCWC
jgi:hypothetical protein